MNSRTNRPFDETVRTSGFYKFMCEYSLGHIPVAELVDASIVLLNEGIETENLFILAGLDKIETDDINEYYQIVLEDLNIREPNDEESAEYLYFYYCKKLIDKEIELDSFLEKISKIYLTPIKKYRDVREIKAIKGKKWIFSDKAQPEIAEIIRNRGRLGTAYSLQSRTVEELENAKKDLPKSLWKYYEPESEIEFAVKLISENAEKFVKKNVGKFLEMCQNEDKVKKI